MVTGVNSQFSASSYASAYAGDAVGAESGSVVAPVTDAKAAPAYLGVSGAYLGTSDEDAEARLLVAQMEADRLAKGNHNHQIASDAELLRQNSAKKAETYETIASLESDLVVLSQQKENLEAQKAGSLEEQAVLTAQKVSLEAEVALLQTEGSPEQLAAAQQELAQVEGRLGVVDAQIAEVDAMIQSCDNAIAQQQASLAEAEALAVSLSSPAPAGVPGSRLQSRQALDDTSLTLAVASRDRRGASAKSIAEAERVEQLLRQAVLKKRAEEKANAEALADRSDDASTSIAPAPHVGDLGLSSGPDGIGEPQGAAYRLHLPL